MPSAWYIASMSSERKNSRLPPPVFPPGVRPASHANSTAQRSTASEDRWEGGDFISPDEPLPSRSDKREGTLIGPEDPLPTLKTGSDLDEGVVTGIGLDAHVEPEELVTGGDPFVMEVVEAVSKFAAALKRKGEAGLHASLGMSRLETTLRAYCVGYLAGRRAEDEVRRSDILGRAQPKQEPPDL
jgi:hypothetical protein